MGKIKQILKYLALAAVFAVVLDVLLVVGLSVYRPPVPESDAIIILGAAINTPALYNRTTEGLRLYQEGKGEVLVLSGGKISDTDISEAQYMQRVINRNSVEYVPVILEDGSHNTYENIKNSREKIPQAKSVVIVSDKFHLARAVLLAKRNGFKDVYWSSPEPRYYNNSELAYYYLREITAMISYIPKFIAN